MTLFGIVTDVKEEHSRNALSLIVVIPSEMMTVTSLSLISFGLIFISPVPVNVSEDKEEQSRNTPSLIVILFGIVIEVKDEHPSNAFSPIVVIPSEIIIVASLSLILLGLIFISPVPVNVSEVKEEQPRNPQSFILALFGIVIEVKEEQS